MFQFIVFSPSMSKNILLTDELNLLQNNLFAKDEMFCFSLVAMIILEYSHRETYF
jgi:hypothetical protein